MTKKLVSHAVLGTLLCSLSMCTGEGTETDNPVLDFDATECKGHSTALSLPITRTSAALLADSSAYDGLNCYAWENHEDGATTIDVINYRGGCSVTWGLGGGRVADDRIDIDLEKVDCAIAACGSCLYDFTFEVGGVDTSMPADVQLRDLGCGGAEDRLGPRVRLAIDASDTGIVCRSELNAGWGRDCGRAHLRPCTNDGAPASSCADGCGEGLVCVTEGPEGAEGSLCFTACNEDADCPIEVESCQDGACRLRETF